MSNYYEISPTHDTLTLLEARGSANIGVRFMGDRRVEARAMAVPMEGTAESWLTVEPPVQREMQPGQTQTFKVTVAVPPGAAPGRHGFRLDVVSVDNPDEEYARGPLVTFQVGKTEAPEPEQAFPWWMVIVAAVLLILIIAGWWASRNGPAEGQQERAEEAREQQQMRPQEPAPEGRDRMEIIVDPDREPTRDQDRERSSE